MVFFTERADARRVFVTSGGGVCVGCESTVLRGRSSPVHCLPSQVHVDIHTHLATSQPLSMGNVKQSRERNRHCTLRAL